MWHCQLSAAASCGAGLTPAAAPPPRRRPSTGKMSAGEAAEQAFLVDRVLHDANILQELCGVLSLKERCVSRGVGARERACASIAPIILGCVAQRLALLAHGCWL